MKFILFLVGIYFIYRYFIRVPYKLPPSQEPDLFIDHEEVRRDHEKNK